MGPITLTLLTPFMDPFSESNETCIHPHPQPHSLAAVCREPGLDGVRAESRALFPSLLHTYSELVQAPWVSAPKSLY